MLQKRVGKVPRSQQSKQDIRHSDIAVTKVEAVGLISKRHLADRYEALYLSDITFSELRNVTLAASRTGSGIPRIRCWCITC